ncbi:MAG: UDP-N-acetylglucosamine 2-epimerase (hydrolyzing) [Flavobacterium sp. BFFFF1]|uniref:UDP-N-acetylglucosamine 2-epimerase n=1 Tax=unclassified Flavobacterium TaxID=196869 RepID=UPI000BDAA7DE|nr:MULTISPECIES: UDP-N-acetylglucosamine 2-epimerase [unclassified Flavobacterium]OYU80803.1 MAG: UDP-N-acetylglucosamine 2-epimerase (hydrolyzing) [Flavobacterium sp. BFFFF1]
MKKILFLTGTRADFGKVKSLIEALENQSGFEVFVFVTGMHLLEEYGYTLLEIERCGFKHIHTFHNHTHETTMDLTLAKTIEGFSAYCKTVNPDMIVVHGDRPETLAGAIVGSFNNILVAHIEGGELSGTVDELIRHSVTKLSHVHFVSNSEAEKRLIQMGELPSSVYPIGSPDIDIMRSETLPTLTVALDYYNIEFSDYAIAMFHPVTTESKEMAHYASEFAIALLTDERNYIVIFPNNDLGSRHIIRAYDKLKDNPRFRIFPSLRFEYFLTLLKHSKFIIGNSSAGIREAPYYGIPTINVGTRQFKRTERADIMNVGYELENIKEALQNINTHRVKRPEFDFGSGNSTQQFLSCLTDSTIWSIDHQKQFNDN